MTLPIPALRVKGKPQELGEQWLAKWPGSPLVEKPTVNGTFMPIFFKTGPLTQTVIPMARKLGTEFGKNKVNGLKDPSDPSKGQKRIVIEFSSPNIAKPFHAGHLRSTIIGGFLAKLYESAGWDVKRINYLGDWGKQYGLLALGFDKYGNDQDLEKDPINHLFHVYVQINNDVTAEKEQIEKLKTEGKTEEAEKLKNEGLDEQARRYFKLMTEQDPSAIERWQRFRGLSITKYKATYKRLNIEFDEYSGESQVSEEAMNKAAATLLEKGIAEESDNALIVDFSKHVSGKAGKSLEKPVIRKKDGTALYLTRDISELLHRFEKYHFDKMIYVSLPPYLGSPCHNLGCISTSVSFLA